MPTNTLSITVNKIVGVVSRNSCVASSCVSLAKPGANKYTIPLANSSQIKINIPTRIETTVIKLLILLLAILLPSLINESEYRGITID